MPATTLSELLERRAAERPDAEAVVFPDGATTYAELTARADRFARGLTGLGVTKGDRVGILLPASADLLALLIGATRIGAIAVPVNARFRAVELAGIVVHSGMRVIVTDAEHEHALPDDAPELEHVVVLGRDELPDADPGRTTTDPGDTAVIVYTSGTTAAPKGAMLPHSALTGLADGIVERMRLTSDDRVWTAIPLFHGGGLTFAFSCLAAGAPFVHPGHFDPSTTLEYLTEQRVTIALAAFETIWMPVLDRPDFAGFDLSRIRVVMAVGVPKRLRDMASRLPGAVHVSCVAMTESSAFLTLNRLDDPPEARATTGGHPMPGMECRVVDPETGRDQPPGTPGELLFRGPNAFTGYFRDPEHTASVIDADGWFHSGDVVVADDDGRLTFRSRLKDMLKVGGENVAAAEVEDHLLRHPAVAVVAVVAAPDARYVEVPAAYVQLRAGASATEQELIDFCLGRIATYRVPRYVRFVDGPADWPMSGTKIKKYVLRERIAAELAAAGVTAAPKPVVPS
ncbi:class I adenylate-forming enzyme family protein [Pseudonocardia sp.]|uniref:class I adenylate-forming enzyme family protein n=1 Tax=Pseudonocardia sp. TaxID=60912 RepID=UPI003D0EDBD0